MNKKQVIFFVGQDVTAHLIMNSVVKDMLAKGVYEPVLYFPKNTYSARADIAPLREFAFYDKILLNETVYPFINKNPSDLSDNLSPQQFAKKHGLHVENVDDVNNPDFVAHIQSNDNIACALSIRCTQLFRKEITEAVTKSAPFMNLHSGLLPDYRGVMPTIRRMFDIYSGAVNETDYGMTLHKVDYFNPDALHKGIDTGKIIEVKSIELNLNHSGYMANVGLVDAGAEALINVLSQIENNYTLRGYPQNNDKSAYYTFPTQSELEEWKGAGLVLVEPQDAVSTLVNAFSRVNTPHGDKLTRVIRNSINTWYSQNCSCSAEGDLHSSDGTCPNFDGYLPSSGLKQALA